MGEFGYRNIMQVPRLEKIVLNIGLGEALKNSQALEAASRDIATISGHRPVITRAKRPIAAFRLRAGMAIGTMVTLRGERMYHFLDRLVNAVLPRIRDFRGTPRENFDGRGNYSLGLTEQLIFPEIHADDVQIVQGMNVTICTSAKTDEEALELLRLFGMPFQTN